MAHANTADRTPRGLHEAAITAAPPDCCGLSHREKTQTQHEGNNEHRDLVEFGPIFNPARTLAQNSFARILARVRSTPPPHFDRGDTFNESGHSYLRRNN